MNKKRTISVKHPQLVRFRNALREVIFKAKHVEVMKLIDAQKGLRPTESDLDGERVKDLSDKVDKLSTAWKKSICTCSSCGSRTRDMTFNPNGKFWFCSECYQHNHEFYKKKAEEGEIWHDESGEPSTKWYP